MKNEQVPKRVVIVGGGVAGVLTAYHVLGQSSVAQVTVIDPRPELGLGLAYSTPSLRHLLNVPAGKISALPTQPDHFLRWLQANHDPAATPDTFAPRAIFGRYIRALIGGVKGFEHLQAEVVDLRLQGGTITLLLRDGTTIEAENVVLATGNFEPAILPGVEESVISGGLYCNNAWSQSTYAGLDPEDPVTLIGTGLTAVDVVLRLRELGHRGPITAASRHGVFPNRHASYTPASESAIPDGTPANCVAYLRALRAAIRKGMEWRAAIDSLRAKTNDLWSDLPLEEKKRFRRHLQRRWDVVRHRMAPPVADMIEGELASGSLKIVEGRIARLKAAQNGAVLELDTAQGQQWLKTARVINCTGPSMNYRSVQSQLYENLFNAGIVTPGPLGGGLNTSRCGAVIDAQGQCSKHIFNLGPGRLGTLIESIAIPEIREQAFEIAQRLTTLLESAKNGDSAFFPTRLKTKVAV